MLHSGTVALLYALGRTLIRHTQQQKLGGATVCQLPPKTESLVAGLHLAIRRKSLWASKKSVLLYLLFCKLFCPVLLLLS